MGSCYGRRGGSRGSSKPNPTRVRGLGRRPAVYQCRAQWPPRTPRRGRERGTGKRPGGLGFRVGFRSLSTSIKPPSSTPNIAYSHCGMLYFTGNIRYWEFFRLDLTVLAEDYCPSGQCICWVFSGFLRRITIMLPSLLLLVLLYHLPIFYFYFYHYLYYYFLCY